MTVLELLARIAVGWLVLSVIVFGAYVLAMALRNARRERTVRITLAECVPVHPRITQEDVDATWASVWPSAVDDDELLNLEFTSLISTTWEWPDTHEDAA